MRRAERRLALTLAVWAHFTLAAIAAAGPQPTTAERASAYLDEIWAPAFRETLAFAEMFLDESREAP